MGGAWSPSTTLTTTRTTTVPRSRARRATRRRLRSGLEYRSQLWGAKAFTSHGEVGFNAYVQLPLERREFVPKTEEPPPYTRINPRPTEEQWADDPEHRARLARALVEQDFRGVRLRYENGLLEAALTNTRISSMPRAIGRAARTMLSFAPLEVRELRVTYLQGSLPVATYTFVNVPLLQRYFNGMASREQLAPYVAIEYAAPLEGNTEQDKKEMLQAFDEPLPEGIAMQRQGADLFALRGENVLGGRVRVRPGLSIFFNDPSGVFKYELYALATYSRPLARQLFFQAETKLTLLENVSDVTQPSNSELPHVRSDIAEYRKGGDFKLTRLLVNRFYQPETPGSTAGSRRASTRRCSAASAARRSTSGATASGPPTSPPTGCGSATSKAGSATRTTTPSPPSPRSTTAWRSA